MGSSMRRTFVVLSTFSLVALVLFLSYSGDEIIAETSKRVQIKWLVDSHGFILNTPGCQIPDWDPYDPSVLPFISKVKGPYKCPGRPHFMNAKPNGVVALDEHLLSFYYGIHKDNLSCTYRPILRDIGDKDRTDNKFYYGDSKKLEFGVPLEDEFLAVKCTIQEFPNLTQFIPLVPLKSKVEKEKSKIVKSSLEENPLNVIIENLSYFELNGYTKVADNTFPNLVPLLTGQFIEHYWNESVRDMFFDDVDFIWKNYSSRGYRTLFAEDAPHIATFNYLKKGFRDPPADYYFRPFALAVEKSLVRREMVSEKKYPELASNLHKNQDRLTTPFDIHATLVHLLNVTRQPSAELYETLSQITPYGLSLMNPISVNRTCEEANILPHWCPCQTHKPVSVTEPVVENYARFGQANDVVLRFVKHQNDVINRHVILGEKINAPGDYLIVISVSPSGGIFEGTVRYDVEDGAYRVLDDISRLNKTMRNSTLA
ncbi:uncharacterized protein CEXT_26711 [Caerostris extrusa]|uniref:Uncharacterized protein n=1 Tax=Caerostris extrusa TaxID=172846 RepID=A0AAV4XDX1_CAEEX|nr:uncharacterized protein CEXT_26711 [Caerostris extrusa]